MPTISVVIITKNEALHIADCIASAKQVTHDIVVVDSGSTDNTVTIAQAQGARVVHTQWKGYGYSRNLGATQAAYDWIFSLDADERIDEELAAGIKLCSFNAGSAYKMKRINFIGKQKIGFGQHGADTPVRIYNRNERAWDLWPVHESLCGSAVKAEKLTGNLLHYGAKDLLHYQKKMDWYAMLSSEKYNQQGKKAGWLKRNLSGAFHFMKNYFFLRGFLDGAIGLNVAKTLSHYTLTKYRLLHQLNKAQKQK